MSSTNRGSKRVINDAYYTPDVVARACVATLPVDLGHVWEPHAGGGAFVEALRLRRARCITATDLDAACSGGAPHDALDGWPAAWGDRPDWIVGNPPYTGAEDHVKMALSVARVGVAFLLRLAFLEGQGRVGFWREHPPAEVYVLSQRPSFTGGRTDSAAYGWFVWHRDRIGAPTLGWIAPWGKT